MILWIVIVIGAVWLYTQYLSPKASALKEARKMFRPIEVGLSMECFGRLCENMIQATSSKWRNGIEVWIYIGQQVGERCSISLNFTNFEHRNIRDMLPAYLYAESLGWEDTAGALSYNGDDIKIAEKWIDIALTGGTKSAYKALVEEFLKNCPSLRLKGTLNAQDDGVFQKFEVNE